MDRRVLSERQAAETEAKQQEKRKGRGKRGGGSGVELRGGGRGTSHTEDGTSNKSPGGLGGADHRWDDGEGSDSHLSFWTALKEALKSPTEPAPRTLGFHTVFGNICLRGCSTQQQNMPNACRMYQINPNPGCVGSSA